MGNAHFFKKSFSGVTVPPQSLAVQQTDTKTGNTATTHTLTGVPAGALLVLTTALQHREFNCTVTSSPSLTWTKAQDATGAIPSAEIHTATFTAGGNISVTSNWGAAAVQTSVCYVVVGQDTTLGVGTTAIIQDTANVNITTTKTNSIIFCVSVNWNAPDGGTGGTSTVYRGTPIQSLYYRDPVASTFWHYRYAAPTVVPYTLGYSSPVDPDGATGTSTAVLEVKSLTGVGPAPDTTPPTAFTLSSASHTYNSINLAWTASTDAVGMKNPAYTVYYGTTSNPSTIFSTTNSLSAVVTGLTPSTAYWLKVRATDTSNNFRDSNILNITTNAFVDVTPPAAPTITSPSKTSTSIQIAWSLVTDDIGVSNYEVYRNGTLINTVANNVTTFNYTALTPSTSYTLKIRAKDAAGNGTDSNSLVISTLATADTTPPSAPVLAAPSATDILSTSVALNWTASTDNVGGSGLKNYEIWYTADTANEIATTTNLTYTVTGLNQNTSYTFYVKAVDNAGNEASSNQRTVTTDIITGGQPLNFTAKTGDFRRYWGGAEFWGAGTGAVQLLDPDVLDANGNPTAFSEAGAYRRFTWADLEGNTQGSYKFSPGNKLYDFFATHMAQKRLVSFGIITAYPDFIIGGNCGGFHEGNYIANPANGVLAGCPYPTYVHQGMQNESSTKDWVTYNCRGRGDNCSPNYGDWIPNYNSPTYLSRLDALHAALVNWFNTTTIAGTLVKNAVGYIDLRGVGSWGEWHHGCIVDNVDTMEAAGTFPTDATFHSIIDSYRTRYANFQLVAMLAAFDKNHANGAGFDNTQIPATIGQYIMDNGNAYGNIGIRRDQWGDPMGYYHLIENNSPISGPPTRYLTAPIGGEPPGYAVSDMIEFPTQAQTQHASVVGNSNYGGMTGQAGNMRTAYKMMGSILRPTIGTLTLDPNQLVIQLTWRNFGLTPHYRKGWRVTFEIRNTNNSVLWTSNPVSSFDPYLKLPNTDYPVTDSWPRPVIASGTYRLHMIVRDPNGYLEPLQLAIKGRQTDGSYILSSSVNF